MGAVNIAAALKVANFTVTAAADVKTQGELVENVLKPFLNRVKEGDVVVIYYFGHGFSLGVDNFLVPIHESTAIDEADVYDHFLPERAIRTMAAQRRPGIVLLFLDACRVLVQFSNPGAPPPLVSQAVAGQPEQGDTIISFAADYGNKAYAPTKGVASFYTDALTKSLPNPDVEFASLQRDISFDVETTSDYKQRAWMMGNAQSVFYFKPTQYLADKEEQLWEACLQEGTRAKVTQFLHQNRASSYASAARQWLKDHPAGQPGERITYTHVSPISPELSWNELGQPVSLPQLSSNFGVARTLTLAPGDAKGTSAPRSFPEMLAAAKSIIVTKAVRAKGSQDQRSVRLPFGLRLHTQGVSGGAVVGTAADNSLSQSVELMREATAPAIAVGSPIAEINLPPDDKFGQVVSDATLNQAVKPVLTRARVIGWASISTPASDDAKVRNARALQATFVKYALVKLGVAESKITIVENDASNRGDLRLRLFGIE